MYQQEMLFMKPILYAVAVACIFLILPRCSAAEREKKHFDPTLMGDKVYAHGVVFNPSNFLSQFAYNVLNGSFLPDGDKNVDCTFEIFGTAHVASGASSAGFHRSMLVEDGTATMLAPSSVSKGIQCRYRAVWVKQNTKHNKDDSSTMKWHYICYAMKHQGICDRARVEMPKVVETGHTFALNLFGFSNRVFGVHVRGFDVGPVLIQKKNEYVDGKMREFYACDFRQGANLKLIHDDVPAVGQVSQAVEEDQQNVVLVLPFIDQQVQSKLIPSLDRWAQDRYNPCGAGGYNTKDLGYLSRVYFYHPGESTQMWSHITSHWTKLKEKFQCLDPEPRLLLAKLPPEIGNHHPGGPCAQFFALFDLLKGRAKSFLLMEPDVLPVRSGWALALAQREALFPCDEFWIKGSTSLCHETYGDIRGRADMSINGNALYCVGDPEFEEFIDRVRRFYPAGQESGVPVDGCATGQMYEGGYDHTFYRYLHDGVNFDYARWVLPKYKYTQFIMNMCEDRYDEVQLLKDHPNTYLVHSKSPYFTPQYEALHDLYYDARGALPPSEIFAKNHDALVNKSTSLALLLEAVCKENAKPKGVTPNRCRMLCLENEPFRRSNPDVCASAGGYLKVVNTVPPSKPHVWVTDFHVAPVACSLQIFDTLQVELHAEIDFGNCIHFPKFCKKSLKVLAYDDWRGFGLDPCPNLLRRRFYDAYIDDPEFQRADVFICSHPTANCELYMPFNRSIVVYATTRLEFGRNDKNIDWRVPNIDDRSPTRWKEWVANLKLIASDARNTIAANNMFDVHYIKYHTGLDAVYLPSWCGAEGGVSYDQFKMLSNSTCDTCREILIGPYRDNLDFPNFDDAASWRHPILDSLKQLLDKGRSKFTFVRMKKKYPEYKQSDLVKHPAVVLIPYQVSTMQFFELYRLNIPLYAPSLKLLASWVRQHGIMWERKYGNPARIPHALMGSEPDSPNTEDNLEYWLTQSDFYQFPKVTTFDSWEELLRILDRDDGNGFETISAGMKAFNAQEKARITSKWQEIFNKAMGGAHRHQQLMERHMLPVDFDVAMRDLWNIPPLGPDRPHVINSNERCLQMQAGKIV